MSAIHFKLNHQDGAQPQKPTRAYEGDAGWDLFTSREVIIPPGEFRDVHTDIAIALPSDMWCRVVARSSTARKHALIVTEGIIDTGYRGELFFGVWNMNHSSFVVPIGSRFAQLIIMEHARPLAWVSVDELPQSQRGNRGFGSSG